MRTKADFLDLTIFELLQNYWNYFEELENNEQAIYWFWIPRYKNWCKELLMKKWLPCLLERNYCIQRI